MSDAPKFTAVFDGDLRKFEGNPFHAETPFGRPVTLGMGDIVERAGAYQEALERIAIASPANANAWTVFAFAAHVQAIAKTALDEGSRR